MSSCPACQGLPEIQPCKGYCINVMKGCLAFHSELEDSWNKFIGEFIFLLKYLALCIYYLLLKCYERLCKLNVFFGKFYYFNEVGVKENRNVRRVRNRLLLLLGE